MSKGQLERLVSGAVADAPPVDPGPASEDAVLSRAMLALGQEYDAADVVDGYSGESALSPQTLQLVLQIALEVLQGCATGQFPGTPPASGKVLSARAKAPGLLGRLRVRRAVADHLAALYGPGAYFAQRGDRIVEAVLAAGTKADPADLDALVRMRV